MGVLAVLHQNCRLLRHPCLLMPQPWQPRVVLVLADVERLYYPLNTPSGILWGRNSLEIMLPTDSAYQSVQLNAATLKGMSAQGL